MALRKIGQEDLAGRGVAGLPDVPGLPAQQMQAKFEEVVREVVIPAFNDNAERTYTKDETNAAIDRKVVAIGAGDMAQAVYDPQRTVEQAGGVPAYTAAAAAGAAAAALQEALPPIGQGYRTYTHEKHDGVHTLVGPQGAAYIRFTATAGFEEGDGFALNGVAAEVMLQNGETPQDGFFAEGAQVMCLVGGTGEAPTLNFRGGGASNINYDVVGSTTQPEGKENRFWVNTDVVIPHYGLIDRVPDESTPCPWGEWAEGDIVILTGAGDVGLIGYKGNIGGIFYPRNMYQYDGALWLDKDTRIYQNGDWHPLLAIIYDSGAEYLAFEAGGRASSSGSGGASKNADSLYMYAHGDNYSGAVFSFVTSEKVDLTKRKFLKATGISSALSDGTAKTGVGVFNSKVIGNGFNLNSPVAYKYATMLDGDTVLDVSALSGEYYVAVFAGSPWYAITSYTVGKWWLE